MRPVGGGLPTGYKRVDFLESTGTQWIDTGYVPDNESGILLDQEKLSTGDFVPMGSRNDMGNTRFYALRSLCSVEINDYNSVPGYGWGRWVEFNEMRGRQTSKLNFMNSRKVEGGGSSANLSELPFVPEQPIFMFATNIGGKPNHVWGGRIYDAVISQGESIVMSFVPCLDPEGAPCMFDMVTRKPFYNQATGSDFIYG